MARLQYDITRSLTVCEPGLLPLSDYCYRILVKSQLNVIYVVFISDRHQLSRQDVDKLSEIGAQVRKNAEEDYPQFMQSVLTSHDDCESQEKPKNIKIEIQKQWLVFPVLGINSALDNTKHNVDLLKKFKRHACDST